MFKLHFAETQEKLFFYLLLKCKLKFHSSYGHAPYTPIKFSLTHTQFCYINYLIQNLAKQNP